MTPVIEIRNLEKYFIEEKKLSLQMLNFSSSKKVYALNNINFSVHPKEIVGLVGANGAGKTTLLRILADVMDADNGSIMFFGQDSKILNFQLRNRIGYVPSEDHGFFWRLTGRENLEFFGNLYGIPHKEIYPCISRILQDFKFEKQAGRLFGEYSAGMRRKVAIMRALLHQPEILLFDEITNNLDPESSTIVKNLIRKYISNGKSSCAIWSTHRLDEIKEICDKTLVIKNGNLQFYGTTDKFSKANIAVN